MAERRMMTKKVIHSDAFLDMPTSTQNLYFHLLLEGDDEGFVNSPKKIQRVIGASDDDAKILLAKKFIISFDSGVIVIKHWKMHNYIQKDRFKPTSHTEEKALLTVKENSVYSMDTECIQNGRLGKASLDESRGGKASLVEICENDFDLFWKAYPKKQSKEQARKAFLKQSKAMPSINVLIERIEQFKHSKQWIKDGGQFIPYPATWLNAHGWNDEMDMNVSNELPVGANIFDMIDEATLLDG